MITQLVKTNKIDFENNPADLASIIEKINAQINGLF